MERYLRIVSFGETDRAQVSAAVKHMDERGFKIAGYRYKGRSWLRPDGKEIVQYFKLDNTTRVW